jgi:hypothetical protein
MAIQLEIVPLAFYCDYGLEVVKGRDKRIINKNRGSLYLDLCSFASAMEIPLKQLEEVISFNTVLKGYLAFYRNEQYKIVKVLDIKGFDSLIRGLMDCGCNRTLLITIREQASKLIQQY